MTSITSRNQRQPSVLTRDSYIVLKALAYAIEVIDRLPPAGLPEISEKQDMIALLEAWSRGDPECFRLTARRRLLEHGIAVGWHARGDSA